MLVQKVGRAAERFRAARAASVVGPKAAVVEAAEVGVAEAGLRQRTAHTKLQAISTE
jgi:hypothetical protein